MDTFELGEDSYALLEWSVPRGTAPAELTAAEREILRLVLSGLDNAAIARLRRRSVRTVAHQVAAVCRRLGVRSRLELFARVAATREDSP